MIYADQLSATHTKYLIMQDTQLEGRKVYLAENFRDLESWLLDPGSGVYDDIKHDRGACGRT